MVSHSLILSFQWPPGTGIRAATTESLFAALQATAAQCTGAQWCGEMASGCCFSFHWARHPLAVRAPALAGQESPLTRQPGSSTRTSGSYNPRLPQIHGPHLQCVLSYNIAIMHNNSLTDEIGPEALHNHETTEEVDGRRPWEIPGGTEALWSVMASDTRYAQPAYQGAHSIDKADIS
jgi:hypothetical protein